MRARALDGRVRFPGWERRGGGKNLDSAGVNCRCSGRTTVEIQEGKVVKNNSGGWEGRILFLFFAIFRITMRRARRL